MGSKDSSHAEEVFPPSVAATVDEETAVSTASIISFSTTTL
ncbi:hypothetical protein A2U01_0113667, partial [Trifolium medium]|nr:hypothetical protein [Trifolium medium]